MSTIARAASGSGVARLFASLEGAWSMSRVIPFKGRVSGTAKFQSVKPEVLHYHEQGKLILEPRGEEMQVSRDYWYTLSGDTINVYFNKELDQQFQELKFDDSLKTATASHLCINDCYDASYTFNLPSEFEIRYKILGPAKDYFIETKFIRVEPASSTTPTQTHASESATTTTTTSTTCSTGGAPAGTAAAS